MLHSYIAGAGNVGWGTVHSTTLSSAEKTIAAVDLRSLLSNFLIMHLKSGGPDG